MLRLSLGDEQPALTAARTGPGSFFGRYEPALAGVTEFRSLFTLVVG